MTVRATVPGLDRDIFSARVMSDGTERERHHLRLVFQPDGVSMGMVEAIMAGLEIIESTERERQLLNDAGYALYGTDRFPGSNATLR